MDKEQSKPPSDEFIIMLAYAMMGCSSTVNSVETQEFLQWCHETIFQQNNELS